MSPEIPQHASREECPFCKELLWRFIDGEVERAVEVATKEDHECWVTLPESSILLVMDD